MTKQEKGIGIATGISWILMVVGYIYHNSIIVTSAGLLAIATIVYLMNNEI